MALPVVDRSEFFLDLGSPYAWLSAERVDDVFRAAGREAPVWRPVLLGGLFQRFDRGSWALTDRRGEGISEIERRAREYGLPEPVWPEPWPGSYLFAMRVATFADRLGKLREFALSSFRDAFTRGIDQAIPEHVLEAAARAGLDPVEAATAAADPSVKDELKRATGRAGDLGVKGIPSFVVDGRVHWGDDALEAALGLRR